MSDRLFMGIEIGGTKLQVIVGDDSGRVLNPVRIPVERGSGAAWIRSQIAESRFESLHGIGVGFGGPVDRATGRIACSHQVEGWDDFPLRDWLRERAGGAVPVVVENDSNAACFAEAVAGAGKGFRTVFYCNFGSGVGGALVSEGAIYHGAPPGEMEFGHLRLSRDGATVESRCSGWAVDERIQQECARAPRDSTLARLATLDPGAEARHLAAALAADDAVAQRVLDDVAADIGFALSHVVHLAHPDVIVLGGGLALVGEPFRAAVAAALQPFVMDAFAPGPQVMLAALGEDAVPVGALHLAIRAATATI